MCVRSEPEKAPASLPDRPAAQPRSPRRLKKSADYQHVPRAVAAMAEEYPSGYADQRHSHRRSQLLYACTGVMSVLTDEGGFVVPPQRALWLPHGTQHEVYYRAPVSLRTLYIEPAASAGLPAKTRIVEVSALLRSLVLEAVNLPVRYDVDGRDGRIMALLLDEIAIMRPIPFSAPMPSDARLAEVCRAIFREPMRAGSLDEWVQATGMSRRSLTRLFRRETGMSIAAWRQHVRLLEALSRLAVGHSVTTVAVDVGYRSPSAFTAMFRRTFGTTPSDYFFDSTRARGFSLPGTTGSSTKLP